jgi:hypothetical protein
MKPSAVIVESNDRAYHVLPPVKIHQNDDKHGLFAASSGYGIGLAFFI